MKKLLILAILLFPGLAFAATAQWDLLLFISDERGLTIAWDSSENATRYELELRGFFPEGYTQREVTTATRIAVTKQKTGFFKAYVRACNDTACSDWAASDGTSASPKPWAIFFRVSPVIISMEECHVDPEKNLGIRARWSRGV